MPAGSSWMSLGSIDLLRPAAPFNRTNRAMMIEDQKIEYEDKTYIWSCDDTIESPAECWSWTDENYMSAPQGLV